jgi:hypothetical protein
MQTRIEHVFLIPLFFVFFIISKGKVKTKIQAYHIFILFLFSLIFVFGFLPQLGNAIQGRNAVHLYTFESMQKNVIFQLSRFHHEYLPIPFYIALFGLGVTLFSKQRKLFGIAFFLFLILFLFWPSRVLDSNQPRYYIPIFWVYAIFASYGIYTILKLLQRIKLPWISVSLQIIFILFIFSSASIVLHRADLDTTGNLVLYYEATRVPDQIQELVEPNSIIVGSYSEIIALDGATSLRVMRTSTFLQLQNETLESNTFYFYDGMLSILPPFADEPEIALKEQFLSSYTVEVMDGFPTPYINATLYKINGKK